MTKPVLFSLPLWLVIVWCAAIVYDVARTLRDWWIDRRYRAYVREERKARHG